MRAKAKVKQVSKSKRQQPARQGRTQTRQQLRSVRKSKVVAKKVLKSAKKVAQKVVKPTLTFEQLILNHRENGRKLARSLLRRWRVRMPAEETDSIVDLTLCEAARRYSDKHGASFMTFFFYHLRGNLVRAVATAAKSNNYVVAFARTAGIDVGDWSYPIENSSTSVTEFAAFEGTEAELPEQLLLRRERIEVCQSACEKLDDLEREVLMRSYAQEEPLVDIARSLGYSRCHISRVKKRALDRLRDLMQDFHDGMPAPIQDASEEAGAEDSLMPQELPSNVCLFHTRKARRRSAVAVELPLPTDVGMDGLLQHVAAA